jgi:hypothetical protein
MSIGPSPGFELWVASGTTLKSSQVTYDFQTFSKPRTDLIHGESKLNYMNDANSVWKLEA